MRILLTGATGFIGRALFGALVAGGHDVCALVQPGSSSPRSDSNHVIGTLANAPWPKIETFQPECCVLGAWIAKPGEYLSSPLNAELQKWTVDFARRAASIGVHHFLGLGSCIEYQIEPGSRSPLAELRTPLAIGDSTPYVRAKIRTRSLLLEEHPDQVCWARIFQPYGLGEHPQRLCTSVASALSRREPATLSSPNSIRDFIHVDDVARALVRLLEGRVVGDYNIGTGTGMAIREVADLIAGLLGSSAAAVRETASSRPDAYPYIVADSTRLRSLGWQPILTLRQGLEPIVAALRA